MKTKAKFDWTLSKLLGFIIVIFGMIAGIWINDPSIIITCVTTGAALVAVKTGASAYVDAKNGNNLNATRYESDIT